MTRTWRTWHEPRACNTCSVRRKALASPNSLDNFGSLNACTQPPPSAKITKGKHSFNVPSRHPAVGLRVGGVEEIDSEVRRLLLTPLCIDQYSPTTTGCDHCTDLQYMRGLARHMRDILNAAERPPTQWTTLRLVKTVA